MECRGRGGSTYTAPGGSTYTASRLILLFRSNCCKCKPLEISRLLSHADFHTQALSKTFHQVTQLLSNTTKIVFM